MSSSVVTALCSGSLCVGLRGGWPHVAVVAGDCRGSPSLRRRGVGSPVAGGHVTRLVLKGLRLSGNITLSVLARLDRHHVPSLKGNYLSDAVSICPCSRAGSSP
jgi:hypothetical protein